MRTTPSGTYDPVDLIPAAWPINFRLITANTPVLSPLLTTNVSYLKPNVVTTELKPEAATETSYEYLSTIDAMVIMDPYQTEALMRFTATVSYNALSSKADTLIDTAASLNFVSTRI